MLGDQRAVPVDLFVAKKCEYAGKEMTVMHVRGGGRREHRHDGGWRANGLSGEEYRTVPNNGK